MLREAEAKSHKHSQKHSQAAIPRHRRGLAWGITFPDGHEEFLQRSFGHRPTPLPPPPNLTETAVVTVVTPAARNGRGASNKAKPRESERFAWSHPRKGGRLQHAKLGIASALPAVDNKAVSRDYYCIRWCNLRN